MLFRFYIRFMNFVLPGILTGHKTETLIAENVPAHFISST
jgi:hypothetical protein